jgi:hypothetical protein
MRVDSCQGSDGEEGCSSIDDLMLLYYDIISFPLQVRSPTGRCVTAHGGIGNLDEGRKLISSSFKGSDLIEKCATRFDNHEVS